MPSATPRRRAATLAVFAGLLAAAAPANAMPGVGTWQNDPSSIDLNAPGTQVGSEGLITYNGHAGLGSNFVNGCAPGYVPLRQVDSRC
jgi:hypothetical protein